ncbi:hypothetical protein GCM10023116_23320 [Kistimonas scapharcae]|uniref:Amidase domain-containing protein n=1 Tax=Kistimonas scapharcae TaxID=1036133 RepID=A0ABP8V216_9GAMM
MSGISSTSLKYLTSQRLTEVTPRQWSEISREVKQCNPKSYINRGDVNRGWILKTLEYFSEFELFRRAIIRLNGFNQLNTFQFEDLPQPETASESQETITSPSEFADDPKFFDYQSLCVREKGYIPENRDVGEIQESDPNNNLESFKGLSGEDIETVINNHLEAHPEHRMVIGDAVQSFEEPEPSDDTSADKIPIARKSDIRLKGKVTNYGIPGDKARDDTSIGCMQRTVDGDSPFRVIATCNQHQLGAGNSGHNPNWPNIHNVYSKFVQLTERVEGTPQRIIKWAFEGDSFLQGILQWIILKIAPQRQPTGSSSGPTTLVSSGACPLAVVTDGLGSGTNTAQAQGLVCFKGGKFFNEDGQERDLFNMDNSGFDNSLGMISPALIARNMERVLCGVKELSDIQLQPVSPTEFYNSRLAFDHIGSCITDPEIGEKCRLLIRKLIEHRKQYQDQAPRIDGVDIMGYLDHQENAETLIKSALMLIGEVNANAFNALDPETQQRCTPELKLNMNLAQQVSDECMNIAKQNQALLKNRIKSLHENGYDFILTPVTCTVAPEVQEGSCFLAGDRKYGCADMQSAAQYIQFSSVGNLPGLISATIPIGHARNSEMPVGIRIMMTSCKNGKDLGKFLLLCQEIEYIAKHDDDLTTNLPTINLEPAIKERLRMRHG